ncbi:glycosyltransferase involved in cell wall biosynthesis [Aeribacillus composti]|uniref:glycosyltransferase family 4 protein n=1 Tax=Aeribacillus TaxID=1055323 RepID=UPI00119BACAB|nr:glycosyltransferase family 4 protein [Aeribacillus composti]MED1441241.1 glycosyltransferase family 4 protein [Aeribacillus composti]TVZ81902.1 glycosyltransferase involved in cell wall biosynthesis [Aeribacillus composti]
MSKRVAILHDWLVIYAGAEKVLEQLLKIYPDADLFSLVDFIDKDQRGFILNKQVTTSFIQKLPFARRKYRSYLPFMPLAIEQLDVSKYDIVISSSHAVAKGVITGPDQLHISYVHSPIRYAWDLQHQYLKEAGLDRGMKGWIAKTILHYIRNWDYRTSNGVDYFVANSKFIARRIWKVYRRKADVIYPPVDVSAFTFHDQKEDFYLTASRMVPYKKIDLIVEAFSQMPDKKLVVIGDGPDFHKIKAKAASNVKLLGYQPFEVLRDHMQRAKAFVFAAEEDFGITPVEAQACGTPVIAYGKGGALETIRGYGQTENPTGLFFEEQTIKSLVDSIKSFENISGDIKYEDCRENALCFSPERFRKEFEDYVNSKLENM